MTNNQQDCSYSVSPKNTQAGNMMTLVDCDKYKIHWNNELSDGLDDMLYSAIKYGHEKVFDWVMSHPLLTTNELNSVVWHGISLFNLTCRYNRYSMVRKMILDSRVELDSVDKHGDTPFQFLAWNGKIDLIKLAIATGRPTTLCDNPRCYEGGKGALAGARMGNHQNIIDLLDRYKQNAEKTRSEIRLELNM
jgi:ankyrin repeat protein